jgi:hypothetical protein
MRLQRISFGRSDIPPRVKLDDCRGVQVARCARDWIASLDLELRVLRPTQEDLSTAPQCARGNEPATPVSHEHEQVVAPRRIEAFDQPRPTLVPAVCRETHLPATSEERRGLHLDTKQPPIEVGNEVVVRAVPEGDRDLRSLVDQPGERRQFADVTLFARREHRREHTFDGGRNQ